MGVWLGLRSRMGRSDIPVRRRYPPHVRQGKRRDLLQREEDRAR